MLPYADSMTRCLGSFQIPVLWSCSLSIKDTGLPQYVISVSSWLMTWIHNIIPLQSMHVKFYTKYKPQRSDLREKHCLIVWKLPCNIDQVVWIICPTPNFHPYPNLSPVTTLVKIPSQPLPLPRSLPSCNISQGLWMICPTPDLHPYPNFSPVTTSVRGCEWSVLLFKAKALPDLHPQVPALPSPSDIQRQSEGVNDLCYWSKSPSQPPPPSPTSP